MKSERRVIRRYRVSLWRRKLSHISMALVKLLIRLNSWNTITLTSSEKTFTCLDLDQ